MAGLHETINAHFRKLVTSLSEQLHPREIRRQLRAASASSSTSSSRSVARVLSENAGELAGVLPPPVGLALQSVLFLADFAAQALDNIAAAASLPDQLRHVEEQLHRLKGLGSLPDDIQYDVDRITETLLQVSVVVHDLHRGPQSGWQKCTSCLHALLCAKCNAEKLQGVAAELSMVLNTISSTLDQIFSHRIGRPAEKAPELPAHLDAGMAQRVSKVMEFLRMNTSMNQSVRVVGLHGEGGIGKTTLMYVVHDQLMHNTMPQLHKIATVEVGMKAPPSTQLQKNLFSQLSGGIKLRFSSAAQGRSELRGLLAKRQLDKKPVCIFLDNVWECKHLEELLPEELADVLPDGSYMVITSRSAEVVRRLGQMCFKSKEEEAQGYLHYQLELLREEDAVTLFLENASRRGDQSKVLSRADELVRAVVPLCGGLPLALAVYGAFFKDESKRKPHVWGSVCKKLIAAQDLPSSSAKDSVFDKLKLSIEFQSKKLQEAFLDVALFFNRNDDFEWNSIQYALEEEDYLESLVEQSLVRVRQFWRKDHEPAKGVVVHDLLVLVAQQMAKERSIAISPPMISELDPCQDGMQVQLFYLQAWPKVNYPSTSQMKGCRYLILKDLDSKKDSEDFYIGCFLPTITKHCHNIRLLQLGKYFLDESHWVEQVFPWIANLKELTVLFLPGATTFHMASIPKICFQLRLFSFEEKSQSSAGEFNFANSLLASSFTSLRGLSIYDISITKLPPQIGQLTSLMALDLRRCASLVQLPPQIGQLTSMTLLLLGGCVSLAELPPQIGQLTSLMALDLGKCASLAKLPPQIGQLKSLTKLHLGGCTSLVQLPSQIGQLVSLTTLLLRGCTSLVQLPPQIGQLTSLTLLHLGGCTSLMQLPPQIGQLTSLMWLHLSGCTSLVQVPPQIEQLASSLTALDLAGCVSLAHLPPQVGQLTSLTRLYLGGCSSLVQLPPQIEQLTSLTRSYPLDMVDL